MYEARLDGTLVARHEDEDHLTKIMAHIEGISIEEARPFELHADDRDSIIDSFHTLEEAQARQASYKGKRFPKTQVRSVDGEVLSPPLSESPTEPPPAA